MAKDPLKDALDGKEDPEVTDPPEGDEEDTEDVDDEEEAAYEPPSQEAWDKVQGELKRARLQAKRLREEKAAAKAKADAPGKNDKDTPAPVDTRWQTRAMRSDAKAALLAEGADPSLVELALSKLKPEDVEYDEDDEPIGISEWVEDMQDRYPKLFKPVVEEKPAPRRGTSLDQGAGAKAQRTQPKESFGQRVMKAAAASQGGRRVRRG